MLENWLASLKRYFFGTSTACSKVIAIYTMYAHKTRIFLREFVIWSIALFILMFLVIVFLLPISGLPPVLPVTALLLSVAINIKVRMVVCENGLEFYGLQAGMLHALSSVVISSWDNLSHFAIEEEDTGEGVIYHHVLYLHDGRVINIGKVMQLSYLRYRIGGWLNGRDYRFIVSYKLTNSDFGKYLMTYAPQVIEELKRQQQATEALVAKDSRK